MFALIYRVLSLWMAGFLLIKMNQWLGSQNRAHHGWVGAGETSHAARLDGSGRSAV